MITVTFTQEELNTIVQAFDVAIKATGLTGARAVLPLVAKLEQAAAPVATPKQEQAAQGEQDNG